MNLDVTADDSCLDPHVSCVQTSHPAAPLDVNSEQRSVRQSMMSGPHRGDSAHIHYDVWDIGEVHPGVVVQVRRGLVPPHVQDGMDAEEAQGVRAEGLDPDDPAVATAIDMVRWELSLLRLQA